MNHTLETHEQYALIHLQEPVFDGAVAAGFETLARELLRDEYSNIILNFGTIAQIDQQAIGVLKKINVLCGRELGILVLVAEDDDFCDTLDNAKIRDAVILFTVEEAIDAVFMHDLENEFGAVSDDFEDDELDPEGFETGKPE
jgi:anti-anti-sigma regulatory factor